MLHPQTRPCMVETGTVLGLRAGATDYRLRAERRLPPNWALEWIAGLRVILGPRKVCTRPGD
eukprot:11693880-Alexandrium_andersonii.AAC.1